MIEACFAFRPASIVQLRGAVGVLRQKQLRERYAGDLLWQIARGLYKEFPMRPYSDYADLVEGKQKHEKTNDETKSAAERMILMFLPKEQEV